MSFALWTALCLLACLGLMTAAQLAADGRGRLRDWLRPIASETLRGGVGRSVLVLALLPGLALTVLVANKRIDDREEHEIALIADAAQSATTQVEAFVVRHTAGIRSAAEAIGLDDRPAADRLGQWLLRYHPIYPDLRTMLISDASGVIIRASRREGGRSVLDPIDGMSVSDRAYFARPMDDAQDYVSDVFRGRAQGAPPLIAISSRVMVNGRPFGVIEGSLDVHAFKRLDGSYERLLGARVVIADSQGRVIYSDPSTGYTILDSLAAQPIAAARESSERVALIRGGDGSELLVGHGRTSHGWSVLILKRKATLLEALAPIWPMASGWLALFALFASALAWALARRVVAPMDRLVGTLDTYRAGQLSPFRSLAGLPREYRTIFRHLHGFVVRLAIRHRHLVRALERAETLQNELRTVIEQREAEITQRTSQLADANRELQVLSRMDPLTQLANRRWFGQEYERLWRAAARDATPLGVILLDVDFFKRYNDCYGHPAGDAVLQKVAATLRASLHRGGDVAARYGGEEFVVVVGNTDLAGALAVAERIRAGVATLGIEHSHSPNGVVSVSVGVCAAHPGSGEDRSHALRVADRMLYEAKALGRNRVAGAQLAQGDAVQSGADRVEVLK